MKKNLLLVVFIFSVSLSFSQKASWKLWENNKAVSSERIRQTAYSANQKLLQFDANQFKLSLANVPQKASGQAGVEIQLPNINGQLEKFLVWESSNFEPALQAQFPEIKAYVGKGITDPSAVLNFSFDPKGIETMIFRANTGTEFIEPYTKDRSVYIVFDSATRYKGQLPFACSTEEFTTNQNLSNKVTNVMQASNQVYKTMRLALSCTAEYTIYHGGTVNDALTAMNVTMTRCNGVFERDLAIKLLIVANNANVIFTNPSTDPYSTETGSGAPAAWNSQLQATLNNTTYMGAANYDIGHLFGASGGGGSAGCIGCVCVDATKGSGITSPADNIPEGDSFDIDYVAHEMGHQMGATHTFAYGGLSGTEDNTTNVEPGSGSTIMAYAGIGGNGTDMQAHSDDYFTFKSITQIQSNMNTKTCPVSTSLAVTNPKPTSTVAGAAFSIPISTAFKLTGAGVGTAGEVLTYCWEENDDATVNNPSASIPSPTKTDGPNFRSRLPSLSPVRYFPQFSDVLMGNLTPTWETTSSVARTLAFTFTVRDNVLGGGQTSTSATTVTVVNTGAAFAITNPATDNTSWTPGTNQTITWNVAGTTANGINTANVNILLSTDGGATFPTVLAASTANDGTETITLPAVTSPSCRILIEAVGNVFYAVSKNIGLGYTFATSCTTYSNNTALPIPDGVGANLPGATVAKSLNIPVSGTISDVNVTVAGTHSYYWDLVVALAHPDGTQTALFNRNCNATSTGFNVLFNDAAPTAIVCAANLTGTFKPNQALSAFNGKNMNGTWTLLANDNYNGDTGSIGNWSVEVCAVTAQLSVGQNQLANLAIYPNPNKGNFNIQFENTTANEITVNVYDISGRTIFENKYSNQATFNENIQLNNAQAGVYLVSVTDGNQKLVKRIVIE
ncbi:zinc-dependent metalloprotease [Flavobacterium wongokense]|uniref:zinc-dependent metalloprotease n=1 Tax=Flavobacterium wongokense TaxID=2910674 RepID=UPI001F317DEC|nr:zinc-dependent metalloprotease family protein [Flavobacterium sp. WG47]MCF6131727.1 M12 family metallo-peptidase [Flavobacterium sp. WG47]